MTAKSETLPVALNELEKLLSSNPDYLVEDQLNKNKVAELAHKYDSELIDVLASSSTMRKLFFVETKKSVLVFNKDKFIQFISNKEFLPDSYTIYKNKIGLASGTDLLTEKKDVVLNWPYKDCVLEGGQDKEDAKRTEVFFNQVLAPDQIDRLLDDKVLTGWKRYDNKGEHVASTITDDDNLVIQGNNLLALHSLHKRYAGKVKLIFIDPPYNTEHDSFEYNDKFTHSTWLTFIKNRLQIARELLADDGVIYVHLDWNEVHYCKVLMDEVFGRKNFLNEIIWAYKERETSTRFYNKKHDTILFYAKDATSSYTFNYDAIREDYSDVTKEKFKYTDENGKKYRLRTKDGRSDPAVEDENTYRQYLDEDSGPLPRDWFVMPFVNQSAKERVFDTQKPEQLLKRIILASTNKGDLVMDFFAGSGTTGAVAHKLGRRYILTEQMHSQSEIIRTRLKNVIDGERGGISSEVQWKGGGHFVECNLLDLGNQFIEKVKHASTDKELEELLEQAKKSSFLSYKVDPEKINPGDKDFASLSMAHKKQLLVEVVDHNRLYVNYSEIDDADYGVSAEDKALNRQFYGK